MILRRSERVASQSLTYPLNISCSADPRIRLHRNGRSLVDCEWQISDRLRNLPSLVESVQHLAHLGRVQRQCQVQWRVMHRSCSPNAAASDFQLALCESSTRSCRCCRPSRVSVGTFVFCREHAAGDSSLADIYMFSSRLQSSKA